MGKHARDPFWRRRAIMSAVVPTVLAAAAGGALSLSSLQPDQRLASQVTRLEADIAAARTVGLEAVALAGAAGGAACDDALAAFGKAVVDLDDRRAAAARTRHADLGCEAAQLDELEVSVRGAMSHVIKSRGGSLSRSDS